MEEDGFVERLISDVATFHISGKVNRHNVPIWGTEQTHAQIQHRRHSPKVNVFCAVSLKKVHGPFFSTEATVTGDPFLDMLENWLLPQLNTNYDDYVLRREGRPPPPTISTRMYECFSFVFFHSAGSDMLQMETTFSRVKDSVYVPPLLTHIQELSDRITHALQAITADRLHRVWDEFDYRVNGCRMIQGAHIEGL
jgi:hypothetical protein